MAIEPQHELSKKKGDKILKLKFCERVNLEFVWRVGQLFAEVAWVVKVRRKGDESVVRRNGIRRTAIGGGRNRVFRN